MEIFTPKALAMGLPYMGQTISNKVIYDVFNEAARKRPEMFTFRDDYDGFLNKVPNKRSRRIKKKFFKYII